ncbi:DUF6544 family protein [Cognataquiflexum rubidum]|uniref:DUF6544 family protein n=1 Tax=Cognataquiflexum rubidum TaxID=2922273 RepID=UPI001F13C094|nr:DUF6544 family protein [Cognataquiflexum rubidum]MCH6233105.1 hypothetical protein [Cognataquiflexum rubidum]
MKTLFMIILLIHGLIHLLGFMKAFLMAELSEITSPVSKTMGLLWLLAALILLFSGVMIFLKNPFWWLFAIIGVLISQVLIIVFWKDSLYGTIPNVLILTVALAAFAHYDFEKKIRKEVTYILENANEEMSSPITEEEISQLPKSVQTWMKAAGVLGKSRIQSVFMEQNYQIKLKPEQKDWYTTVAEQYSTISPPAFVWKAKIEMMPAISAFGRDKFIEGNGEMVFKLFSVFPVANDGPNPQINEAALQRFLGEIVWYPTASLNDNITWKELGNQSAKATLTLGGLSGSGIFSFGEDGHVLSFSALRYQGSGPEAKRSEWTVNVTSTKEFDGIKVPASGEVTWKLDSGDWTWAKFEIVACNFNPNKTGF